MGRVFIAAHSAPGAARFIRRLALRTDVYVGVGLRTRAAGGRDAVDRCAPRVRRDRQTRRARPPRRLRAPADDDHHLRHAGARARVLDARRPLSTVSELEQANRWLAHHLGADLASSDAARILRPPASWNHKHAPPAPVELVELAPTRQYEIGVLTDGLEDPPGARPNDRPLPRAPAAPRSIEPSSRSRPPTTPRSSPAARPTAPARSSARSTTIRPRASSCTETAPGTASAPARPEGPSTTSRHACGGWRQRARRSCSSGAGWHGNSRMT